MFSETVYHIEIVRVASVNSRPKHRVKLRLTRCHLHVTGNQTKYSLATTADSYKSTRTLKWPWKCCWQPSCSTERWRTASDSTDAQILLKCTHVCVRFSNARQECGRLLKHQYFLNLKLKWGPCFTDGIFRPINCLGHFKQFVSSQLFCFVF